ncbi:MarR family winged helix-turn-helix transcriptional regulator [Ureibacillus composti]
MGYQLKNLDIVDLISERHVQLREFLENQWNNFSNIRISNTEWFILNRIYGNQPTIASITKSANITRQATHKNVKSLEAKGLVEIVNAEQNKRDKCIRLTPLGERCFEKYRELTEELERKLTLTIGVERMKVLIDALKMDWELN